MYCVPHAHCTCKNMFMPKHFSVFPTYMYMYIRHVGPACLQRRFFFGVGIERIQRLWYGYRLNPKQWPLVVPIEIYLESTLHFELPYKINQELRPDQCFIIIHIHVHVHVPHIHTHMHRVHRVVYFCTTWLWYRYYITIVQWLGWTLAHYSVMCNTIIYCMQVHEQ